MSRRNHPKYGRRSAEERYDLDYVSLLEYPGIRQVVVKQLKTIYINIDADYWADGVHVARSIRDPILRRLAQRKEADA